MEERDNYYYFLDKEMKVILKLSDLFKRVEVVIGGFEIWILSWVYWIGVLEWDIKVFF